jgi:type I restriction enzyme S subunit
VTRGSLVRLPQAAVHSPPGAALEQLAADHRFRRYPAYKDSGVEWLGEIPAHWNLAPVYARYEVALGKMLDAKRVTGEFSGPYLRNIDVQWDTVNTDGLPEMDFAPWERGRYLLRRGDLLVCEGGEVGRTALWGGEIDPCFYQKALHRVRPLAERESPRFFYYLMCTFAQQGVFTAGGNQNTIDHLTAVQLRHYRLPFAASGEQHAIAAFLDRETARVDALVAKKERLIELLQEKRTALITRAVSKGLDPRDSTAAEGPEGVHTPPATWTLRKLRRLVRRVKRPVPVEPEKEYAEIGIRSWGRGIFHKDPVRGELLEDKSVFLIEPGDFVLNIVFAWEGAVAVASDNERGMVASHRFPTFRPSEEVDLDYLLMILQSEKGRALMGINSPGAAGRNRTIRLNQFLDEEVSLPLPAEQREIVSAFRREETRLDALIAKVHEAIERLKELRTALISAAVTGKIDVRSEVEEVA